MDTHVTESPNIGHNQPPEDADPITARLAEDHATLLARRDELSGAFDRVPEEIADEETAGKAADFIKQISACAKNADKIRVDEKEPYLEGGRKVDGFFKAGVMEPLDKIKKAVSARLTAYQRKKDEEERRRREEEARAAREEEARARREAEEKAAALAEEQDLDAAIAAEESAKKAAAASEQAARAASANAAETSRTRSSNGSVASLRPEWKHREDSLDRATIDLEALRDHLPMGALHQAVRAYIKAGGRDLKGVEIFEDHVSVVR